MHNKSTTVSIRLPSDQLADIDRLAEDLAIDRATIIKRLVAVGMDGLLKFEKSGEPFNWPRAGQMTLQILPGMLLSEKQQRDQLEQMVSEVLPDDHD